MKIEIRKMLPEDIPGVAALEQRIFSIPWSAKSFSDSLKSEDTGYYTAWVDGMLAGYCGYLRSFCEADITNMAVSEEFQGCGVGYTLLHAVMEAGRQKGIERYTLEVRVTNAAAIRLYEKLGFERVGIRPGFYEKPREDALIMWTKGE